MAIVWLAWPRTLIRATGAWYDAPLGLLGLQEADGFYASGHGATLAISEKSGEVRYFDYGRYESPAGLGRVRDEDSDPELRVAARAAFSRDGGIANIEEILLEVSAKPSTRGEGPLAASVLRAADFDLARAAAKRLQAEGLHPYGSFGLRRLNCARLMARLAGFGRPPLAARLLLGAARLTAFRPLLLVRLLGDEGILYVADAGGVSRRPRWAPV